ncbi:MAG: hypothetical protein K6G65_02385 [Lachnospiraceae bacterium]|nr:hypothetical protein [Lachnospiraceae bacterium]
MFSFRRRKKKEKTEKVIENTTRESRRSVADDWKLDSVDTELSDYARNTSVSTTQDLKENCKNMVAAQNEIAGARTEYGIVTSYLTDIQKLEREPMEKRKELIGAAKNIVLCLREQEKGKERKVTLSAEQIRNLEQLENTRGGINRQINEMKEQEKYALLIEEDIRKLENEKKAQRKQRREILFKQRALKRIAIAIAILVFSFFVLFVMVALGSQTDMSIPYSITVLMAGVSGLWIFIESRKNRVDMKNLEARQERLLSLINSVNIKQVNSKGYLDYVHEKYKVTTADELEYQWKQYLQWTDYQKKSQMNSEKLDSNMELLKNELLRLGVQNIDVWSRQPEAFIDEREMVEARHNLNVRRQMLRERVDYNMNLRNQCLARIQKVMDDNPELEEEINAVLRSYDIEI